MAESQPRELRRLPKSVRDISFRPDMPGEASSHDLFLEEESLSSPELHIGKYSTNNGILAYVDGNADTFCIPLGFIPYMFHNPLSEKGLTPEMYRKIESIYGGMGKSEVMALFHWAGYRSSQEHFFVPHSNDAGQWAYDILTESKFLPRIQRQLDMEKRNRRLGVESRVVLLDQFAERFKPAWEEFDWFEHWVKMSGMYNTNNGVLVYVDQYAIPHVAPYEGDLKEGLRDSGFEHGDVYVPHSNDAGQWLLHMFPGELEERGKRLDRERLEALRREAGVIVVE